MLGACYCVCVVVLIECFPGVCERILSLSSFDFARNGVSSILSPHVETAREVTILKPIGSDILVQSVTGR